MAIQTGQAFGNYRIVRLIGEGGFGEVYLAENPLLERRAAVKVLHAALAHDGELVRRFLNEARAASAIRHPNIVEVFDAGGTPEGAPYILMEYLEGESLQKRLADVGRLPLAQVLEIASQAASALTAAHAAGIVHRDLKPENLFLVPDAEASMGERVKVLDFGIAKIMRASATGGTARTRTGLIMGSPAYMSPEQCKDSADVDLRADIYSLAIIVYEMLAGRPPYVAASGTELLLMHLGGTPPPLRELAVEVPSHVQAAVTRALARAREDRFDHVAAFVSALRGIAGGTTAGPKRPEAGPTAVFTPASPTAPTAFLPAVTTFSRATGELRSTTSSDSLTAANSRRRWKFFAIAALAIAGIASFLLMRPGHPSAHRAATEPAAKTTETATVAQPEPSVDTDLAAPPYKADAGTAAPTLVTPPTTPKRPPVVGRHRVDPSTRQKERKSEDEWLAH